MPSMLTLHLVLLNLLNVVQTLRDHEVMPLISNDFKDETVPGSEVASHLELRETETPDVHVADDVDGKHLEQSFRELKVTKELLARAKELQADDLCSNGTSHLSGDFKVTQKRLWIGKPCNITADRVTLFLEHHLYFYQTVHFHGDLAVVALRRPLDDACVRLLHHAFVEPGAVLRLAGCQNANRYGSGGGAMWVDGDLDVRGELHIRDSWAKESGGAIYVWKDFTQSGGTLTISNASAETGGAIYVKEGSFTQSGGNLTITDASAESDGGAIFVGNSFNQSSGTLTITHASAEKGGAIYVKEGIFNQSGGTLTITDASAESDGGAIVVEGSFTQSGGNLTITDVSAESDGGAMWIGEDVTMKKNRLFITHATAKIGGGIWVGGNGLFEDALGSFDRCHALEDGGGIRALGDVDVVNTSLTFNSSIATRHGAALVAKNLTQYGGDLVILNSSAGQDIISVSKWTTDTASAVRLEDCRSETFLTSVEQEAALTGTLSSNNCTGAAGTLVSQGPVELRNAVFNKTSSPQVRAPAVEGSNWIVTGTETWIRALCRVLTRLIATKFSVELLMNMEAVAELATRA